MRITNNMLVRNMMSNLNTNLRRMNRVQKQYQTGKKFQVPSDDPIGVSKSLKLSTDVSKVEQYKRNLDDAMSWLDITEDAMNQMGEVIQRARELTVKASNGTNEDTDLKAIEAEIGQLKEQVVKLANTTYAGRNIFTGYKTDSKLLDDDGKYIPNTLEADEISRYNIGVSEDIPINTVGIAIFGNGDATSGGNFDAASVKNGDKSYVVAVFDNLQDALKNGDTEEIDDNIERMDTMMNNLLSKRAQVGAKTNRLELTKNRLESEELNFTELLSNNEDVDMAEVIIDFKTAESVYRASLSAGTKIIQPSLVDFLR